MTPFNKPYLASNETLGVVGLCVDKTFENVKQKTNFLLDIIFNKNNMCLKINKFRRSFHLVEIELSSFAVKY